MKPFQSHLLLLILAALNLKTETTFANSADQEQPSFRLSRTADTPDEVTFTLSKNVYRKEPYQANYEVQVPYQEEEAYTVEVPYQTQEAYQDRELYVELQYRCHNETRYRSECHTETRCSRGILGNITPRNHGGHGNGGHGNGGNGPHGPRPDRCHTENICVNVPYSESRCNYEPVTLFRWVTKYRTVTQYRTEMRTRTITKYRSETRCCETRMRDVFDHQYALNVSIKLPRAQLLHKEIEHLEFQIQGTESNPTLSFTPIHSIYTYQIAKQEITGTKAYLELSKIPNYNQSNAGFSSLANFEVKSSRDYSTLQFYDAILSPHIKSTYDAKIKDIHGSILAQGKAYSNGLNKITLQLDRILNGVGPAVIEMNVERSGDLVQNEYLEFSIFKGIVIK